MTERSLVFCEGQEVPDRKMGGILKERQVWRPSFFENISYMSGDKARVYSAFVTKEELGKVQTMGDKPFLWRQQIAVIPWKYFAWV